MYSHQDWEPIVLRNTATNKYLSQNTSRPQTATVSHATNKSAWKIEQQVDSTTGKPLTYVSKEDAQKIIQGRIALKLTQKDLASRVNMQLKDIADIENCKAIENKTVLSNIKRAINII